MGRVATYTLRSWVACVVGAVCINCSLLKASQLEFVGNDTFAATELQGALDGVPDYYFSAHIKHDQAQEIEIVEQILTAGYRAAGFAQVKVSATSESKEGNSKEPLRVQIKEGERFYNGSVLVNGVDETLARHIAERVSSPYPTEEAFPVLVSIDGIMHVQWKSLDGSDAPLMDPIWEQGKATDFTTIDQVIFRVQDAVCAMGYPDAKLEVLIAPNSEDHLSEMRVNVTHTGLATYVNQIRVLGVYGAEQDDVINYLGLKLGDRIDTVRIQELTRILWESGRFTKHRVISESSQPGLVTIELEKAFGVPWISETIDEKGQTILDCQKWLLGLVYRGDEILFASKNNSGKSVISQKGIYLEMSVSDPAKNGDNQPGKLRVVHKDQGTLIDYSPTSRQALIPHEYLAIQSRLSVNNKPSLGFELPGSPQEPQPLIGGKFSFPIQTGRDRGTQSRRYSLAANPSDLLPLAYREDVEFVSTDSNVQIGTGQYQIVIEKVTGRVVLFQDKDIELKFGSGMFDAAVAEIAPKHNQFDNNTPIRTLTKFACDIKFWEILNTPPLDEMDFVNKNSHFYTALEKLAKSDVFKPLEQVLKDFIVSPENKSRFKIPSEYATNDRGRFTTDIALYSLKASTCFEPNSWPAKVLSVNALLTMYKQSDAQPLIDDIISNPKIGPLCYVSLLKVLVFWNYPHGKEVAKKGLKALEADDTGDDWSSLISLAPQASVKDLFATIGSLTPKELQAISDAIPFSVINDFLWAANKTDSNNPEQIDQVLQKTQWDIFQLVTAKKQNVENDKPAAKSENSLDKMWDLQSPLSDAQFGR